MKSVGPSLGADRVRGRVARRDRGGGQGRFVVEAQSLGGAAQVVGCVGGFFGDFVDGGAEGRDGAG